MGIFEGKTAIITGTSSGVDYGCAVRFAEEGANVIVCARRMERLEKLRGEAAGMAGTIIPQRCDC
jgi:NADP-dependent 3-hydroxy acid dehydrogenase YdfG